MNLLHAVMSSTKVMDTRTLLVKYDRVVALDKNACSFKQSLSKEFKASFICLFEQKIQILLVPRTEHHLSSFKYGFLNIFSRQNLLRSLSRLLFLLRWNKHGAEKCLKNHIPFDFCEMIQL